MILAVVARDLDVPCTVTMVALRETVTDACAKGGGGLGFFRRGRCPRDRGDHARDGDGGFLSLREVFVPLVGAERFRRLAERHARREDGGKNAPLGVHARCTQSRALLCVAPKSYWPTHALSMHPSMLIMHSDGNYAADRTGRLPARLRRRGPASTRIPATPRIRLIVRPSGHRSWSVRVTVAGRLELVTLAATTLEEAYAEGREALRLAKQGISPSEYRTKQEAEQRAEHTRLTRQGTTVGAAVAAFLDSPELADVRPRTRGDLVWSLDSPHVKPLHGVRLADITRGDIEAIGKVYVAEGKTTTWRKVAGALKRLHSYAMAREWVEKLASARGSSCRPRERAPSRSLSPASARIGRCSCPRSAR